MEILSDELDRIAHAEANDNGEHTIMTYKLFN